MTAVAPTVPQLFLPGQAAAPEGPVDIAPMYLMHRAFRRSCQYEWMFWDAAHRLEGWPV